MAIGIDRNGHRRLMECLRKLADRSGDAAHWQGIERELADAYQHTALLVEQAEKSAVDYDKLRKKPSDGRFGPAETEQKNKLI